MQNEKKLEARSDEYWNNKTRRLYVVTTLILVAASLLVFVTGVNGSWIEFTRWHYVGPMSGAMFWIAVLIGRNEPEADDVRECVCGFIMWSVVSLGATSLAYCAYSITGDNWFGELVIPLVSLSYIYYYLNQNFIPELEAVDREDNELDINK
ncbi:MAG: hypothetical protein C9356_20295 [Oleiphilus sp.]|nr:MAG: hypothetical protein C9356_20295 [Oleiphilus sp.]